MPGNNRCDNGGNDNRTELQYTEFGKNDFHGKEGAPAMGALKVAAIPAAAPHPTKVRIIFEGSFKNWLMAEPMAEPI